MRRRPRSYYKPRSVRNLEKKVRNKVILSGLLIIALIYFLLNWGLPALIGGLSVFNKLKPADQKKEVIEDPAIAPPVLNIPFEATSSSQISISGYSASNITVEIYFDDDLKSTIPTAGDGKFTTDPVDLALGTNNIYGKSVGVDGKKSLPSKTIKLIYNNEKPRLEVSEPGDGTQIKGGDGQSSSSNKKVHLSGKTAIENSVTVNGTTLILGGDGNFSTDLPLNEGENLITIIAQNSVGNTTKIERKVTYAP